MVSLSGCTFFFSSRLSFFCSADTVKLIRITYFVYRGRTYRNLNETLVLISFLRMNIILGLSMYVFVVFCFVSINPLILCILFVVHSLEIHAIVIQCFKHYTFANHFERRCSNIKQKINEPKKHCCHV